MTNIKKLILIFISVLTFSGCFGQRYEVWVKTTNRYNYVKGNYGFFNDSILTTYSNSSLLFSSKDTYFSWDDVTNLKVRNKTRNHVEQLFGAGAGILGSFLVYNSIKKSAGDDGPLGLLMIVMLPTFTGIGTLAGHLAPIKRRKYPCRELIHPKKINY